MKVLVACEYSGTVREAFRKLGHDAISCDLLSTDLPGQHYQGNVFDIINNGFDLMIAHPPCTYLCSSGLHWNKRRPERAEQTEEAINFFMALYNCSIPKISIENPIGCISSRFRKPNQIIQPWMFGEDASKATCLWSKNLPDLIPTNIIKKARYANQTSSGQNNLGPSPDRWKLRSKTYQGIADAMAEQWGNL
jgi:hypothetical protein